MRLTNTEKLKQYPVKKKLNYLTRFLVGALAIVGILSCAALWLLNNQTSSITEAWMPSLSLAQKMNTLTSDYRLQQYSHLASTDQENMADTEAALESIANQIAETSTTYEDHVNEEEDSKLLLTARELWASYKSESEQFLELSRSGKSEEAAQLMTGDLHTLHCVSGYF